MKVYYVGTWNYEEYDYESLGKCVTKRFIITKYGVMECMTMRALNNMCNKESERDLVILICAKYQESGNFEEWNYESFG